MNAFIYDTKMGQLFIAEDGHGITEISIFSEGDIDKERLTKEYILKETELLKETSKQLLEYLEGKRKDFTVALKPKGTKFQQNVWEALRAIPYGETRSYKQIAEAVGNGKASRAVGMANHNNPIMCIIPCHRVIGANGSLVGYAGGLDKKEMLLKLEAQNK